MLKDELLQFGSLPLTLVEDALIVDGASCTLDGDVRAQVEVELEGVGAASFNQGTRKGVAVAVALAGFGEESNVVALASNHNSELRYPATELTEVGLHVAHLFFKHSSVLSLLSVSRTPRYCEALYILRSHRRG